MKKLKMDWSEAAEQQVTWLNELNEFCLKAYESSALYKEMMKKYHDQKIEKREYMVGDLFLTLLTNYSLMDQFRWKIRRVCGSRLMDNT